MYQSLRGTIYALIAGICWGFSGTVGQFLFSHTAVDSGWLTTVRLLVSGLILLVMAAIQPPIRHRCVEKPAGCPPAGVLRHCRIDGGAILLHGGNFLFRFRHRHCRAVHR